MGDDPSDDALERERKLVNGIRSRDPKINGAAHRAIFKAYNRPLFAILRKYSIDGDSAQDLCQLSWLTALRKIAAGEYEPQPERRLFSWLVRIGKYHTLTWNRGWRRYEHTRRSHHTERLLEPTPPASPEIIAMSNQALASALERLPPAQRSAFHQRINGMYDANERDRVKDNFARAIRNLQIQLSNEYEKEGTDDEQHGQGRTMGRKFDQR
jgi:DNA-directed RNA polymerase specialized sigma24 family protein